MAKIVNKKKEDFFFGIGQTLKEASETKWSFIKTGCTTLNFALGGWLIGGIAGVFGDEQTGKTQLALEAASQCQKIGGYVFYDDAAAVLDKLRAIRTFGFDVSRFGYHVSKTCEEFFERLIQFSWKCDSRGVKGLYVLDDLDTLDTSLSLISDEEVGKLSKRIGEVLNMRVNLDKSKVMSALLHTVNKRLMKSEVALFVIQQTRNKIGVTWGSPITTSGGKALKFYATQRVELSAIRKIVEGDRVLGQVIRAKIPKNKVVPPFQQAEYSVYYSIGIDNVITCIDFLSQHSDLFDLTAGQKEQLKKVKKMDSAEEETEGDEKKKKGRAAYAFEGIVYKRKDHLADAVKEDQNLYRTLLDYTKQVWDAKFLVC